MLPFKTDKIIKSSNIQEQEKEEKNKVMKIKFNQQVLATNLVASNTMNPVNTQSMPAAQPAQN